MRIGDLRHRITLLKPTAVINENGFETEGFIEFKTVWTFVSKLSGREYFAAAAVQEENTVNFKIRYTPGIDASMKIRFQDRLYDIISVDNAEYKNRFLEIRARVVEADG